MAIRLNHELKEEITNQNNDFPISYFSNELVEFANWQGPLHWHVDFEIATALDNTLDYQVGSQHITLQAGDSIFVNGNILHRIQQVNGEKADSMPNIVFSPALLGLQDTAIYTKYVLPILQCDSLPFVVFKHDNKQHETINALIHEIYELMQIKPNCYEFKVQRHINEIFEYINTNFDQLDKSKENRTHIIMQIRLQKTMTFIQENYQ